MLGLLSVLELAQHLPRGWVNGVSSGVPDENGGRVMVNQETPASWASAILAAAPLRWPGLPGPVFWSGCGERW
jgi:hypothetical protein